MEAIVEHKGITAVIDRPNIDTDAIIPKQFLRKIDRTGFGKHLFHEWRFTDYEGTKENPDFILNHDPYRKASILITQDNFGCGSSREHAPWALYDFGFRVIIAPSFADIFANNCVKNGILCVRLNHNQVTKLMGLANAQGTEITINLENQTVSTPEGDNYTFEIDSFSKECLMKGLDQIDWTSQFENMIVSYEKKLKQDKPWMNFNGKA